MGKPCGGHGSQRVHNWATIIGLLGKCVYPRNHCHKVVHESQVTDAMLTISGKHVSHWYKGWGSACSCTSKKIMVHWFAFIASLCAL